MKISPLSVVFSMFLLGTLTGVGNTQPKNLPKMPPPPAPPKGTIVHRDLAYVPKGHVRQKLDLYLPPRTIKATVGTPTKRPLIIYIHGGAFMFGDKNSNLLPTRLLSKGYALASLDYRLSGDAQAPANIEDCKAAVRWLRVHATQYGLDVNRFVAWGESAGGNLAALVGTTGHTKSLDVGPNLHYSSAVQGVVDYYGPTDFLQMDAHRVAGGDEHNPADSPESRLIGGPIQQNKTKVEKVNPIAYVSAKTPPFFIAHGTDDHVVPYHQSQILYAALQKAKVRAIFYPVTGTDHGFKEATDAQNRQLDAATDAFLKSVFNTNR